MAEMPQIPSHRPQDKAEALANEKAKVTRTPDGETIQMKSIEKVAK